MSSLYFREQSLMSGFIYFTYILIISKTLNLILTRTKLNNESYDNSIASFLRAIGLGILIMLCNDLWSLDILYSPFDLLYEKPHTNTRHSVCFTTHFLGCIREGLLEYREKLL